MNCNSSSAHIQVEELNRQIRILQMERDATNEEVDDLRKRLLLSLKDNQHLRKMLVNIGEEMIQEGQSGSSVPLIASV